MTQRVAIFAGYNRKGKVEDYVLFYLKALHGVADRIIYVADNSPNQTCEKQLRGLVDAAVFEPHGEYDFGSWKRGLQLARKRHFLDDAAELILCNDSCYGPFFPFAEMFAKMELSGADFWGITKNCKNIREHIQSYFIVFNKNVFSSPLFTEFFAQIKPEKDIWDVVTKYEVGLSRLLIEKGRFRFAVYCPIDPGRHDPSKLGLSLLKVRCPLLKRKIYTRGCFAEESKILLLWRAPVPQLRQYMQKDYFAFFFIRIAATLKRFFYQSKITSSGRHIIKICRIPVYSKKLKH